MDRIETGDGDLTRRGFVLAGGALVAGLLTGCGSAGDGGAFAPASLTSDTPPASPPPPAPGGDTLGSLTWSSFDRLVGDTVDMQDGDDTVRVTVLEAVDREHLNDEAPELSEREPFSVVLEGPPGFAAREGSYRISHPQIGTVEVHTLPLSGPDGNPDHGTFSERNRYEVHFN